MLNINISNILIPYKMFDISYIEFKDLSTIAAYLFSKLCDFWYIELNM